jgi:hypothetical protein
VTVPALALAAGDTNIVLVRAAAMISDIFLNDFILFISPFYPFFIKWNFVLGLIPCIYTFN